MFKRSIGFALAAGLLSVPVSGILLNSSSSQTTNKDLANHQINEIVKLTKHIYAFQEDFGKGNLLPILSSGSGGEFSGLSFTPVMATKREIVKYKNLPRFQAMKDLHFSKNGERLESGIVGNIMVVGKGDSFTVHFPECPQDICSKRSITVSKT